MYNDVIVTKYFNYFVKTMSISKQMQSSLDWSNIQWEFEAPTRKIKRGQKDLLKIMTNIDRMVTKLSNEEINCRKYKLQTTRHKLLLEQINIEINNYEQLITMGILCGY